MYTVKLSLEDYHLLWGMMYEKSNQNSDKIKELVAYTMTDNGWEQVDLDIEKINTLKKENEVMKDLMDRLYNETGEQLGKQNLES